MLSFKAPALWVEIWVSRPGSHDNIAQFENTNINREDARNGHRSVERSTSDCNQTNSNSNIINKVGTFVERVTGIEPALSAWEAAGALQSTTPIGSCEQEIQHVNSATLPLWVENWVENRRRLESVEVGAA